MQVLPSLKFDQEPLTRFLSKRIQTQGIFRSRPLETLTVHPFVWRAFRRVRWEYVTEDRGPVRSSYSLIDEQCAGVVSDFNESILLWRPRYAEITPKSLPNLVDFPIDAVSEDRILQVQIKTLIENRKIAQLTLSGVTPSLREQQSGVITGLGAFVPRTPARRRREEILVAERKPAQGTLIATSLVTNCPETSEILKGDLDERVGVGTIVAELRHLEKGTTRFLILETAGVSSFDEALTMGRALTRLCELNPNCRKALKSRLTSSI